MTNPLALPDLPPRKPPAAAQWNWITGELDVLPEQLELPLPPLEDVLLPPDDTVTLLATDTGSQLFVSGFGLFLGKKSERLVVKKGKETCAQLPFLKLQEVVIGSHGVSLSSDLLDELCSRGIRLAFVRSSGQPVALLTSPMLTATVETRRAQLAAYHTPLGADFCRWIVAGKIHNQEKLLLYFSKSRDQDRAGGLRHAAAALRRLRRDALAVTGPDAPSVRPTLMGLEGTSGRLYWQALGDLLPAHLGFDGRSHQGATDPVNAMLNYGYGILYSHVWGAVMNAGLEPFAGFLHVDRSGKPSLVLDLTEEFRQPVVDRTIFAWLHKRGAPALAGGLLDGESRESVAARVIQRLIASEPHRGKTHQVRSIIQMQARAAAGALRGQRPYRPFPFKW